MALASVLSWGAWVLVIYSIDPLQAGLPALVLFYLTLSMGMVGVLTLLGVVYRVYVLKRQGVVLREVRVAFRHALFLAFGAVLSLILSRQGYFQWWTVVTLVAGMSVIEYLFLLGETSRRS